MKRIKVGRGRDCDIVIPDECDRVSRHHLVISFDYAGRMTVSDTSSNGTTVNGRPLIKGVSMPVTRRDSVVMGGEVPLDWSRVGDPYRVTRMASIGFIAFALILGVGATVYFGYMREDKKETAIVAPLSTEQKSDSWNADSTMKVAPTTKSVNIADGDTPAKPVSSTPKKKSAVKKQQRQQTAKTQPRNKGQVSHPVQERHVVRQSTEHEHKASMRIRSQSTASEKE